MCIALRLRHLLVSLRCGRFKLHHRKMSTSPIKVAIIGGTGLDDPQILDEKKEITVSTPFGDTSDTIKEGKIGNVPVAIIGRHGRNHSIPPHEVNYRANLWALKKIGCTHVLASTACGSLKECMEPGKFVILDNVIDRTNGRVQTFYDGKHSEFQGICHIPMEPVYCMKTRDCIKQAACKLNSNIADKGTCVTIQGPRFSTKAESKLFQSWGADVVNMTAIPEVVLARELGLCYASVAVVTDYDCWRDSGEKVSVTVVLERFKKSVNNLKSLFIETINVMKDQDWSNDIKSLQEVASSSVMLSH